VYGTVCCGYVIVSVCCEWHSLVWGFGRVGAVCGTDWFGFVGMRFAVCGTVCCRFVGVSVCCVWNSGLWVCGE